MGRVAAVLSVVIAGLLVWTTGCRDSGGLKQVTPDSLPGLVLSAPVRAPSAGAARVGAPAFGAPVSTSVVYVSLAPGSVPAGLEATIRDQAAGASVTTPVVGGGFDPVAIAASVGDTLVVEITRAGSAQPIRAVQLVRANRPPVVVRTDPPPQKVDVPLNSIMVIVFSDPIDSTTLTTGTLQLWRDATPVAGTVRFADAPQIRVEFHPDSLLAARTDYRLVATQGIRDVNGAALAAPLDVPFTTGTIGPATGLVFASVSVGGYFSCGVTAKGRAYCWGYNYNGELGNGTTANSATPVAVAGGLTFAAVSAGYLHACGVTTNGAAYCWGLAGYGALGADSATLSTCPNNTGLICTNPVPVAGGLTFRSVTASVWHTCGLTTDGAAYCWGSGQAGQLGIDSTTLVSLTPLPVSGGLTFAALGSDEDVTCGVTTGGAAYCWGYNGNGLLGTGTTAGPELCGTAGSTFSCSHVPVAVAGGLSFTGVTALKYAACGVTTAGTAYCWGENGGGFLGTGTTTGPQQCVRGDGGVFACSTVPVAVAGGLTFAAIAGGFYHACGVTPTGAAYCWGIGDDGALGNGTITHINPTPVAVAGGLSFQAVSPTKFGPNTCGLTTGGLAYCWGWNPYGLGDGTTTSSTVPVKVAGQP